MQAEEDRVADAVVGVGAVADDAAGPRPKSSELEEALKEFRMAFDHRNEQGSINAWLSPRQQAALACLRVCMGLKPMERWDLGQLDATEEERGLVVRFKERLEQEGALATEHDKEYCTALTLLRYLRARDLHMDKAHAMFLLALQWRNEHRPWEWEALSTKTNKLASDARIVGFDKHGRVVIYSSFANTVKRTPEDVKVVTAAMVEKAMLCVNAGSPGNIYWFNHFGKGHANGFGMRDCNPAFAWSGIRIFTDYLPESLKTMVIIDPPSIFHTLWNALQKVLPEKTREKGAFIDSARSQRDHNMEYLEPMLGEELANYILDLMEKDAK